MGALVVLLAALLAAPRVRLPQAACGSPAPDGPVLTLTLTADGRVLHRDRPTSLEEVAAALRRPPVPEVAGAALDGIPLDCPWPDGEAEVFDSNRYEHGPIPPAPVHVPPPLAADAERAAVTLLHAHRDAPWIHVLWVMPDLLAVARPGDRGVGVLPLERLRLWTPEALERGVIVVEVAEDQNAIEYRLGAETYRDTAALRSRIGQLKVHDTLWAVDAEPLLPVHAVVDVLDAFHAAQVADVAVVPVRGSGWVRGQSRLPVPRKELYVHAWMEWPGLPAGGVLPLAAAGRPRADEERLHLVLAADGTLSYKAKSITLDELGTVARQRADAYHLKRRRAGETGFQHIRGRRFTKLRAMLWADTDVPWKTCEWVLAVLDMLGYRHVELAVAAEADLGRTRADAERFGVPRLDRIPGIEPVEVRMLPALLGRWTDDGGAFVLRVSDDGSFTPPPPDARDARIRPEPRTTWQSVVAAVNACRAARIPCVFDAYRTPLDDLLGLKPLPRPRR